jgi:hypothetical protein
VVVVVGSEGQFRVARLADDDEPGVLQIDAWRRPSGMRATPENVRAPALMFPDRGLRTSSKPRATGRGPSKRAPMTTVLDHDEHLRTQIPALVDRPSGGARHGAWRPWRRRSPAVVVPEVIGVGRSFRRS